MRAISANIRSYLRPIVVGALVLVLAACGSRQPGTADYPVGGGDYRRDGPHANPPANLAAVPDAVPRLEPLASGPNRPYVINGKRYVPDTSGGAYRVRGHASWYGRQFHGRPTSSGERYDMYAMTAAHPTLPIPSYARVTRPDTGRSVIVRINDRGPFISGRVIDLSYAAAYRLDTLAHGTADVIVERIMPEDIQRGATAYASTATPATIVATATSSVATPSPVAAVSALQTGAGPATAPKPQATGTGARGDIISQWIRNTGHTPGDTAADAKWIPVPEAPAHAVATVTPPAAEHAVVGSRPALGTVAFLQLGAFGEAHNAQQLADRIRDRITGLGKLEVVSQDGKIHRVRLGPFTDRNTAVAHVDTVYHQTGIKPHVVGY